ncbi:hypothetical protein OGAPHI_001814 [Ogataea philodendri]|uniref:Rab-GAP TBC domain-containing protein n=1 Tax=Ogataea philodendri TaxID=1378263 RepID=A0A9P8T7D7_9ASCO|nr:uncharacterized protein OGAPHI_001814 [Ogataea philodendri]KAH3668060.1 hypothetical protein OGAPHI_001814 [Ogataea philodendri]
MEQVSEKSNAPALGLPEWVQMECDRSIFNEYPVSEENESLKLKSIKNAIDSRDRSLLRFLVATRSGCINTQQRAVVWPILLDLDSWNPPPCVSNLKHKDHDQITKDVERSFVFYPKIDDPAKLDTLRRQLDGLINSTLNAFPGLNYYQGYHDVAQVAVLVFDDKTAYKFMTKLTLTHLRDHMLPDIESTVRELQLIPDLLSQVDPKLFTLIGFVEPVYALSSVISLFAHDMSSFMDLSLVWDFLLAEESPLFVIYIYVAVLVFYRDDILRDLDDLLGKSFTSDETMIEDTEPDLGSRDMVHVTLSNWISHHVKSNDLFPIMQTAIRYMSEYPCEKVSSFKKLSRYSMLRTNSLSSELTLLHASEQKRDLKRLESSRRLAVRPKTLSLVVNYSIGIGIAGLLLKIKDCHILKNLARASKLPMATATDPRVDEEMPDDFCDAKLIMWFFWFTSLASLFGATLGVSSDVKFLRFPLSSVRNVVRRNLLRVLELQELVASMARHIDKDVGILVREQPLGLWLLVGPSVGEQSDEILHGNFVSTVIHLDVVSVKFQLAVGIIVNEPGERISWVARHIVRQHQNDLRVRNAQSLDCSIHAQNVSHVAIVEPESRRRH